MKQFFFTVLYLFCAHLLSAQTPLYILYDPGCMNKLEYQYTYSGKEMMMFAVSKGDDELYFFKIGTTAPVTSTSQPKGTVSCENVTLNSSEVNAINAGGRLAYIVHRVQNGYLSMPVEIAGQIFRAGSSYVFRSSQYDFLLDTSRIDYASNLSQPGVASAVYLTGMRDYSCRRQYAFRLEPLNAEQSRMDIELIPGIGIVSNRAGRNGSEMEQNVYRLLKINGIGMERYIENICTRQSNGQTGQSGSFFTGTPADEPNRTGFIEPDKETYSNPPDNTAAGTQPATGCPEKPGYGYHIVQQGESLNSIARMYNLTSASIAQWNHIADPNKIEVCQKLWLSPQPGAANQVVSAPPSVQANEHVVQKGESVSAIARKYKVSEAAFRQANGMPASGDVTIYPGQRLRIPGNGHIPTTTNYGGLTTSGSASIPADPYRYSTNRPPGEPSSAGRMRYQVQRGESIQSIASKYGYTNAYFRYMNRAVGQLPEDDSAWLTEGITLYVSDCRGERTDLAGFQASMNSVGNDAGQPSIYKPAEPVMSSTAAPSLTGGARQYQFVGEYIVKPGDTMSVIAKQHGMTEEKLADANGLAYGTAVQPGTILKIPK
ncbi:MAG: LysM peptidoglycan-binding domain-containing protein [Saprospiraceae bacterium]|nr:LysM peptidoglycan-binding domain-containing protein [Saprospiraceae bacterium]